MKGQLNPDFSHRLSIDFESNDIDYLCSIELMACRARSMIDAVRLQFEGERLMTTNAILDILFAANCEIDDIKATICAVYDDLNAKDKVNKEDA